MMTCPCLVTGRGFVSLGAEGMVQRRKKTMGYERIPENLKRECRWVGWKYDTSRGKVPYDPNTGLRASSTDPATWSGFDSVIDGKRRYAFDGIGFVLGDGWCGIDLDNHIDRKTGAYPMTDEEFVKWSDEVMSRIDSYSEKSPSGQGVHILFRAVLPEGRRRSDRVHPVEMYDRARFFTMTGDVILDRPVEGRQEQALAFWKEYVDDSSEIASIASSPVPTNLSDSDVISRAGAAKNGWLFRSLYEQGDTSGYNDDSSAADMALCSLLAFWTGGDEQQMDRIFRSSALMRDKWDRPTGKGTYGSITISKAVEHQLTYYGAQRAVSVTQGASQDSAEQEDTQIFDPATGKPDFSAAKGNPRPWDTYQFNDYGNAQRFIDEFGDIFRFNYDDKAYMTWSGTKWCESNLGLEGQFANELTVRVSEEADRADRQARLLESQGKKDEAARLQGKVKAFRKGTVDRIASTNGMKAMLERARDIRGVPANWSMFDRDPKLLNTKDGIVNMETGKLYPHDRKAMLSMCTGAGYSTEEPERWCRFLKEVFYRGDKPDQIKEQQHLVEFMQIAMGVWLYGDRREQYLFILTGDGSNGKSTMMDEIGYAFGDYYGIMSSKLLMSSSSDIPAQNAFAMQVGVRALVISETRSDDQLDMGLVKNITGDALIQAQKKYGQVFTFKPKFNAIMMTNELPTISEMNYATWRRILTIPFQRKFSDSEKDVELPMKLFAEGDRIIGWCVKGYQKYLKQGGSLEMMIPEVIKRSRREYMNSMDNVTKFLDDVCKFYDGATVKCYTLYRCYVRWAADMKISSKAVMSNKDFNNEMQWKKGFKRSLDTVDGEVWVGMIPDNTFMSTHNIT